MMDWWYYSTTTGKILIILGLVAMALLAIIIASPHVKPLQAITNGLGLTRTILEPVYINHTVTVYVNKTVPVYINNTIIKTVPIYINRTIIVAEPIYVYTNTTSGVPIYTNTGVCHLYSLVLPNGTIWTLGYWLPTSNTWRLILVNNTILTWGVFSGVEYGMQLYTEETPTYAVFPGLGTVFLNGLLLFANIPNRPMPNWPNMIYLGDFMGLGPIMYEWHDYTGLNNGTSILFNTWWNYTTIQLPVNRTYTVLLEFPAIVHDSLTPTLAIPCNWTFIGPVNPELALRLPAPMSIVLDYEVGYVVYGSTNLTYPSSWGWWVWGVNVQPVNLTSLPWSLG